MYKVVYDRDIYKIYIMVLYIGACRQLIGAIVVDGRVEKNIFEIQYTFVYTKV